MFSRLKNLFASDDADEVNPQEENPNFITRPRRIRSLLFLLMEDRTQVTIHLDDEHEYPSTIREISEDGLRFDEFSDRAGHKMMVVGQLIKVKAKHQAVHLIFESEVTEQLHDGYLASLPNRVYYPQRRSYYRVPLNSVTSYGFRAAHPYSNKPLSGRIEDMSYGGVCLVINDDSYFKKGDLLSPTSLVLTDDEVVNCNLVVCTIKKSTVTGLTRLGCEFLNLDANARRNINQFIVSCERERKKKGLY